MTIKDTRLLKEADSGFGFFLDKDLTQEFFGDLLVTELFRIKRLKLYFGNPKVGTLLHSNDPGGDIVIYTTLNMFFLGRIINGGKEHAIPMWFDLTKEELLVNITSVYWIRKGNIYDNNCV